MKFEVDGVNYELVESPTFGEARAIEKITGVAFSAFKQDEMPISYLQAMVWVSMKRVNPTLTFEETDDIDMSILAEDEDEDAEADPEVPTDADAVSSVETTSAPFEIDI